MRRPVKSVFNGNLEVYASPGTDPKAPCVVYCHGLAGLPVYSFPVLDRLDPKRGFYQFAFPGHGELPYADADLRIGVFAERVAAWLNGRPDLGPIVLMGHSMGGAVAALAAGRVAPGRIKRVVLAAPYGPACFNLKSWAVIRAMLHPGLVRRWLERNGDGFPPEVRAAIAAFLDLLKTRGPALARLLRHLSSPAARSAAADAYAKLAAPTWLVLGDEDEIVPHRASVRFFRSRCGALVKTLTLHGADHLFPLGEADCFAGVLERAMDEAETAV